MKKIMFNDKYGLTKAVLEGRKTMTRRIAFSGEIRKPESGFLTEGAHAGKLVLCDGGLIVAKSAYKVGEVVAVAQSYENAGYNGNETADSWAAKCEYPGEWDTLPGFKNKMFVQSEFMPHQIRITNVRLERLQDISDEDCLKEGIYWDYGDYPYMATKMYKYDGKDEFIHPKIAFASLIDRLSGKGTFESNPWVFVYEFELVK